MKHADGEIGTHYAFIACSLCKRCLKFKEHTFFRQVSEWKPIQKRRRKVEENYKATKEKHLNDIDWNDGKLLVTWLGKSQERKAHI